MSPSGAGSAARASRRGEPEADEEIQARLAQRLAVDRDADEIGRSAAAGRARGSGTRRLRGFRALGIASRIVDGDAAPSASSR